MSFLNRGVFKTTGFLAPVSQSVEIKYKTTSKPNDARV